MQDDKLCNKGVVHINVEPLPSKYRVTSNLCLPCDWCMIFNTRQFFELHRSTKSFYFQLISGDPAQVLGVAHFSEVAPGHYRSPRRGTFGGFEFREKLRMEVVEGVVAQVEQQLIDAGAEAIEILHPPASFNPPAAAVLYNILARRGYCIQPPELDYTLAINNEDFLERVEYNLQKRIKKCQRENIRGVEVEPLQHRRVYDVISANRAARGFSVSMTYDGIEQMVTTFPDRLVFFGVFAGSDMIASSICIRLSPTLLYVFYWGDLPGWQEYSPVSLLAMTIYDYACRNGCLQLDLGTSTIDGVPNYGLINFKRGMGCQESLKLTFIKRLA